jgi:hypothetical protein
MAKKKRKDDKIFGNDYNTGNIEFEFFSTIKVKEEFSSTTSKEFTDNSYTAWEKEQLREDLYEIFENAPFRDKYAKIKKVPKNEMVRIYYYFSDQLHEGKYSTVQVFTEIAEFMKMNYKDMFHQLLPVDKQNIVRELGEEYNIAALKKQKRLF